MKRAQLIEALGADGKIFLTKTEAMKRLGCGKSYASKVLDGTDYIPIGNTRRYFIYDIADCFIRQKRS